MRFLRREYDRHNKEELLKIYENLKSTLKLLRALPKEENDFLEEIEERKKVVEELLREKEIINSTIGLTEKYKSLIIQLQEEAKNMTNEEIELKIKIIESMINSLKFYAIPNSQDAINHFEIEISILYAILAKKREQKRLNK
jgi:hypothetical protein